MPIVVAPQLNRAFARLGKLTFEVELYGGTALFAPYLLRHYKLTYLLTYWLE